jgi:ribosomal-protein-alanine N-acetyltransferase
VTLVVRPLTVGDAPALVALREANREHFAVAEPAREPSWFTVAEQEAWIAGEGVALGAFADDELAGYARLSQIFRGGFQNAFLGYAIGRRFTGRGLGTATVRGAVGHAFGALELHRVQANVRTDNPASRRVLEKAGFRHEGLALRYLHLAGAWRDHDTFAITAEEWPNLKGTDPFR